jgi:hypothetical protein
VIVAAVTPQLSGSGMETHPGARRRWVAGTAYNDQTVSNPTMRLRPTRRPPGLEPQQRLACSKCKAHFVSYQMIKINDKQLCVWCAGHPEGPPVKTFSIHSKSSSSAYKG